MIITPVSLSAITATYTGTPGALSIPMLAKTFYQFTASTACWIKQGTAPTAAANTAANLFVPLGTTVYLDGTNGPDLSVVQDAAAGKACLAAVKTY